MWLCGGEAVEERIDRGMVEWFGMFLSREVSRGTDLFCTSFFVVPGFGEERDGVTLMWSR